MRWLSCCCAAPGSEMRIYLDWNATAPLRSEARAAWLAAQDAAWANPASLHQEGQDARAACDHARAGLAALLGAKPHELVVCSGGTEANATAIRSSVPAGGVIAALATEHSSVLRNAAAVGTVVSIPVDGVGRALPAAVAAAAMGAELVCLQVANNEIGTVQDLPALTHAVRAIAPTALILADACQLAGKLPLDLPALGADLVSLAAHKWGGPKGIGFLWVRPGVRLTPLLGGGRQQQDRRSGTEDAALQSVAHVALAAAVAALPSEVPRQRALIEELWQRLSTALPALVRLGAGDLPNTLAVVHPGLTGEALVQRCDLAGLAISKGAACMAARGGPSHVAAALGLPPGLAQGMIRLSLGHGTRGDDIAAAAVIIAQQVNALTRRNESLS